MHRPDTGMPRGFRPFPEGEMEGDVMPDTDADNEQHIRECGSEMEAAYARYAVSSEIADLGDAHYWRNAMEDAIRARSAGQVARLEAERGLT